MSKPLLVIPRAAVFSSKRYRIAKLLSGSAGGWGSNSHRRCRCPFARSYDFHVEYRLRKPRQKWTADAGDARVRMLCPKQTCCAATIGCPLEHSSITEVFPRKPETPCFVVAAGSYKVRQRDSNEIFLSYRVSTTGEAQGLLPDYWVNVGL